MLLAATDLTQLTITGSLWVLGKVGGIAARHGSLACRRCFKCRGRSMRWGGLT